MSSELDSNQLESITDHAPTCHHNKVYADYMLMSHPPQRPWICSICGEKGAYSVGAVEEGPTYDELIAKFHGGGA